jgi:pimeloyl-ACP methyl ester carboxylesterase
VKKVVNMGGPGFIQRLPVMAEIFQYPLAGRLFVLFPSPDAWIKIGLKAAYHDQRLVDREHIERYAPCYRDRAAKRALVETCRTLVPPDTDDIAASYRTLHIPVLLLWGRHDLIVPLSQGERLFTALPDARLEVVEDCGHNPQEEKPRETFAILDGFCFT